MGVRGLRETGGARRVLLKVNVQTPEGKGFKHYFDKKKTNSITMKKNPETVEQVRSEAILCPLPKAWLTLILL